MDIKDRINDIASRANSQKDHIQTEEATKTALILPFLSALGYDVFNPSEVIPEFTADVGTKKNEKVDYAIKKDGDIIILIECKSLDAKLSKEHASQLFRYFSVTEARFSILTNGTHYQFFSDLETPNKMDSRPFFEFDILDFHADDIEELKKFSKSAFSLSEILETANTLKYLRAAKKVIDKEMSAPSDEFIRFITTNVYEGRLTAAVVDQFREIVKVACRQYLSDQVNSRLQSALNRNIETNESVKVTPADSSSADEDKPKENGIVTTEDEKDAFLIVKAILRQSIALERVVMRDTKSYCGILLDDNNRKPICRMHYQFFDTVFAKEMPYTWL